MKWVLTVEKTGVSHIHLDVADLEEAAMVTKEVLNEQHQEGQGAAKFRAESYDSEWVCTSCGERKFDTDGTAAIEGRA